ncbi:MAG TPA: hypothetical protein VFG45_08745 [Candidatus Nitrosocosmicus sp.]|nr:hypothetical protein [Candidatus Nitrosocosmicus sp.]
MIEELTLVKNSPKFASLKTTVPMSIIKQLNLKEGDKIEWSWKISQGEIVVVASKKRDTDSMTRITNVYDQIKILIQWIVYYI